MILDIICISIGQIIGAYLGVKIFWAIEDWREKKREQQRYTKVIRYLAEKDDYEREEHENE